MSTTIDVAKLLVTPARNLKDDDEALAVLSYLASQGAVQLIDPHPSHGQITVGTTMAGVEFMRVVQGHDRNRSLGAHSAAKFWPTPPFAVVLYRLALRLACLWAATKIVWGGVGNGDSNQGCHATGNCIDFFGASTARGGTFDVHRDWYLRDVYVGNGKLHPGFDPKQPERDRWGSDTLTYYRLLAPADKPKVKDPSDPEYQNPQAREFFLDVYRFISEECRFGPHDISPAALQAGLPIKEGYTLHPDYPTKKRVDHKDHMHFQLGDTHPGKTL
jgi:hypothetical protein